LVPRLLYEQIGLVSHATELVQLRVQNATLCCKELRAVPVYEIEFAERLLMEGLNYEFRCYHTVATIEEIFAEFSTDRSDFDRCVPGNVSPRAARDCSTYNEFMYIKQTALEVAQQALIFSDTLFLNDPRHTAFAIAAIATGSVTKAGYMGSKLHKYLAQITPATATATAAIIAFSQSVRHAIRTLLSCPLLDLSPTQGAIEEIFAQRAENFRRVLSQVALARALRKMKRSQPPYPHVSRKRMRVEQAFTPPRLLHARKYAKVTPTAEH
jgi:hypothetical protein